MEIDEYSSKKKVLKTESYRIAFVEEGMGENLVLLHGLPTSAIWREVLPLFSSRFRCLAIDTPGLGDSILSTDQDYTLKGLADVVISFLNAKRIENFYLIGHDLGGGIAQIVATSYPEMIKKMILADSTAYDNWPSSFLKRLISIARIPFALDIFCRKMHGLAFARSLKGWGNAFFDPQVISDEIVKAYIRPIGSSRERIRRFRKLLLSLDNRETMEIVPKLKEFQRPTMILWSCDNIHRSTSWAIRLYHDIPGAKRFELIPFAGLFSPEEKPKEFATIVLNFLSHPERVLPFEEGKVRDK